jgi:lipid II:glycine glycyltransferase (peptidoglycan interpeptide bridge formation enzyme)
MSFTNTIPTQDIFASKYWKEVRKNTGNKIVDVNETLWIQCTKLPYLNMYGGYIPRADVNNLNEDELRDIAKRENIFFIKVDPVNSLNSTVPLKNIRNSKKSLPVQYQHSAVINLEQSEEQFLEGMKSKHRYNLKVAEKSDLKVSISNEDSALDTFLTLYKQTALRQGYTGRSEKYLRTVFETLKSFNQDLVYIATVSFEGKPISSWMLFVYEDTIMYPYGGSSEEHRSLMGTYKLVYEIFKWGKVKGMKYFDLFGIDAKNPEDGYSRFKLGFGVEEIAYADSFDIVYDNAVYFFYKIWERINR